MKLQSMTEYERSTPDFAYFGDKGDFLVAFASSNMSDIVRRANFIALQRALPEGSFVVEEFKGPLSGCFGGWVLIDPARQDAIDTATRILEELEDYPVIDDEVLSEVETEEALESAEAACDLASSLEERQAAAPFILNKSEENNRGVGYASDYWPTEADVFFGFLAYKRSLRACPVCGDKRGATVAQCDHDADTGTEVEVK